tara:strand:+ start:236 stop:1390 length:1155 start_codon:yes stop_codon:yes gene_type:complete
MQHTDHSQAIEVNPAELTAETSMLLRCLLQQSPDKQFFDALDNDGSSPIIYKVQRPHPMFSHQMTEAKIFLTYNLIRFARSKNNEEYRYAVCDKQAFQRGGEGFIYASHGTIKIDDLTEGNYNIIYKTKTPEKARVLKELVPFEGHAKHSIIERAVRESDFLHATGMFRDKKPILSNKHDRAALLMRRAEGKELLDYAIEDAGEFNELNNQISGTGNIFTVDQRIALTIMIGEALLNQSHKKGIIHRDIKAENIIIKIDNDHNPLSATFVDYGVAKWEHEHHIVESIGTVECMAPEIFKGRPTSQKSDSYSFIIMADEMIWRDYEDNRYEALSTKHQLQIQEILKVGKSESTEQRLSLTEVINRFKTIKAERELEDHFRTDPRI